MDFTIADNIQFSFQVMVVWSNLPDLYNSWEVFITPIKNIRSFKNQITGNVTKQTPTFTSFLEVSVVHSCNLQQTEFYINVPVTDVTKGIAASYRIFLEHLEVAELVKKVESPRSQQPATLFCCMGLGYTAQLRFCAIHFDITFTSWPSQTFTGRRCCVAVIGKKRA
jgi:hypothetical protein